MRTIKINYYNQNPHLFDYPMENQNCLSDRKAYILNDNTDFEPCIKYLEEKGIKIQNFTSTESISNEVSPEIAIVFPPKNITNVDIDSRDEYYRILFHYIKFAQLMINNMSKQSDIYHHLIFIFPHNADHYSSKLGDMAYYALTGLIGGLGKIYASQLIIVNGLIMGNKILDNQLTTWIEYLVSNNSNNLVGQNIKL